MLYLFVAVGGGLGAVLRYALSRGLGPVFPSFPAATMVANVLAGLVCGAVTAAHREYLVPSNNVSLFITTGMMGGLSTFSTFSVETVDMLRASRYLAAGGNVIVSLVLCLGAVFLSYYLVRRFIGS